MMPRNAIVLFAHGARDPRWAEPFAAVAAAVRESAGADTEVALAFLELMAPTLGERCASLAAKGVRRIDIVPLFLGMGGHLREDLPLLVDAVRAGHPQLDVRLHPAVGERADVIAALARAALAAAG